MGNYQRGTKNHLMFYLITGNTSQQVYATDNIMSSVQVCIAWTD